jgi:hypothetical protein
MFRDQRLYPWVLPTVRYPDTARLLAPRTAQVIEPAERKAKEITQWKAEG